MMESYLFAAMVVVALAVATVVLLRHVKAGGLAFAKLSPIRLIGHRAIGTGASAVLIEIDGRRMLLGVSRAGIVLLDSRDVPGD